MEFQDRYFQLVQDLDPFKKYPVFRKASDVAQATGITYAILHNHKPVVDKITRISNDTKISENPFGLSENYSFALSDELKQAVAILSTNPDYKVCKRVPEVLPTKISTASKQYVATIIDLETMELEASTGEIIETAPHCVQVEYAHPCFAR